MPGLVLGIQKYKFQSFHTEIDLSDNAHEYFISMDQVKKISFFSRFMLYLGGQEVRKLMFLLK